MPDKIEFWMGDQLVAHAESSHAPDRGDLVNIRKSTYRVIGRTYTMDDADDPRRRQVVCAINMEPQP